MERDRTLLLPPSGREQLLAWFRAHGRNLPWRATRDPYAILVSEYMLQQTQAQTVVPYYQRWMQRFPTPQALAAASEEEVLALWQGLGYYARARRLRQVVRHIVSDRGGEFPATEEAWRALPGIGPYTAAAVQAFAHDRPAAVVDANIARVLTRWAYYQKPVDTAEGRRWLLATARALQPVGPGAAEWNGAVMELGALLCRAGLPDCSLCPVQTFCRARAARAELAGLPVKKKRPATTVLTEDRALWLREGRVQAVVSAGPRWSGLLVLPECADPGTPPLLTLPYSITRYRIRLRVHLFREQKPPLVTEPSAWRSLPIPDWAEFPWAAPHRRAVARGLHLLHT